MKQAETSWRQNRTWLLWVILGGILLLAAGLRLYGLGSFNLWEDEIGQAVVAQKPLSDLWEGVRSHRGAAPFDYLITALVVRLSHDEGALRLPAAIWGILAVYWLFRLGRRFGGDGIGLIAAFLLAVSPLPIRYAQELRFYSLFLLLTFVLTDVLAIASQSHRRTPWVLYGLLAALGLYTHYFVALLLLFHGVWLAAQWQQALGGRGDQVQSRANLLKFTLSALLASLAFLPWVWYAVVREQGSFRGPPELGWPLVASLLVGFSAESKAGWPFWLLLAGLGVLQLRRRRADVIFLLTWLVGAFLAILVIDYAIHYFFAIRQMLFALPAYLILIAAGIWFVLRLLQRGLRHLVGRRQTVVAPTLAVFALLIALAYPTLPWLRIYHSRDRSIDWRSAGALLNANVGPRHAFVILGGERFYVGDFLAFYSPDIAPRAPRTQNLSDLEQAYRTGQPLWVLATAQLATRAHAAALQDWLRDHPGLHFSFGQGLEIYYFQDAASPTTLAQTATHLILPPLPQLWLTQAYALQAVDMTAAQQIVTRAQNLPAPFPETLITAGDVAARHADYPTAIHFYDRALARQPDSSDAYVKKGFAQLQGNQPAEAAATLTFALAELGRDDYWTHRWLGLALSQLDRPSEALPHLLTALDLSPDAHDLRYQIGALYAQLGDAAQARQWWQDYLAHDPTGVWAQEAQKRLQTEKPTN